MYQVNATVLDCGNSELETYGVTFGEREILDLSTDKERVENFVKLLNQLELSPIHLDDVIEDFLAE